MSFYYCYIQILVLGAQGIRATGFKLAQGNAHCAKFESHTNRVTFETNTIRMTSSVQAHLKVQAHSISIDISKSSCLSEFIYFDVSISSSCFFAKYVNEHCSRNLPDLRSDQLD